MADKLTDGDYTLISGGHGLTQCDYIDELLQNACILLRARRGEFYPDKNFGSRISTIDKNPMNAYLLDYARQALDLVDGVYVKNAEFSDDGAVFDLIINDKERRLLINSEDNL